MVKQTIEISLEREKASVSRHKLRNQGATGATAPPPKQPLEVAKPPPPPMWVDRVLLVASVHAWYY